MGVHVSQMDVHSAANVHKITQAINVKNLVRNLQYYFWFFNLFKCLFLQADPCSYNTCSNNGTCVSILTTNTFKCLCTSSYQGTTCNNLIIPIANNPCSSNPCNIYQTCTSNGNNYSCSCPPMFTGSLCETKIRACNNSPCQNNAICIDNLAYGNYSCICPAGLKGTNCELQMRHIFCLIFHTFLIPCHKKSVWHHEDFRMKIILFFKLI